MRPPLSLAISLTPAFELGRPLESTPPSLGRPREEININAEFLAGGVRGGCVRAESKRECERAKCERALRLSIYFLDVLEPQQQQQHQNGFRAASEGRDWLRER